MKNFISRVANALRNWKRVFLQSVPGWSKSAPEKSDGFFTAVAEGAMSPNEARAMWNHSPTAVDAHAAAAADTYRVRLRLDATGYITGIDAAAASASRSLHTALGGLPVLAESETRRWLCPRRGRGPAVPLRRRIEAIDGAQAKLQRKARDAAYLAASGAALARLTKRPGRLLYSKVCPYKFADVTTIDGERFLFATAPTFARGWQCPNCPRYNQEHAANCWRCGHPSPTS